MGRRLQRLQQATEVLAGHKYRQSVATRLPYWLYRRSEFEPLLEVALMFRWRELKMLEQLAEALYGDFPDHGHSWIHQRQPRLGGMPMWPAIFEFGVKKVHEAFFAEHESRMANGLVQPGAFAYDAPSQLAA